MSDQLTILRTKGLPATKTIVAGADGLPVIASSYSNAKTFAVRQETVTGIGDLAAALDRVRPDEFVIRGKPLAGTDWRRCSRRLHPDPETGEPATFGEKPRRWLLLDFDTVPAPDWLDPMEPGDAAPYLRSLLPDEFQASSFWWSYTSSAGIKPELRLRLAFWLERAVGKAELDRWLAGSPVDATVFRTVQATYVARPILQGVADPVPRRSGLFVDVDDTVPVPELPPVEVKPAAPTHSPNGKRYVKVEREGQSRDNASEEARDDLARLSWAIRRGGKGNRHRLLLWAAARSVELDRLLSREEIAGELLDAARRAGLDEPDKELERQIANGFKIGVFGGGAAA